MELDDAPEPQGPEGQQLVEAAETVRQHWSEPVQQWLDLPEEGQPVRYRPMLPNRSFVVRVRYKLRGRGKPLPYPRDAE